MKTVLYFVPDLLFGTQIEDAARRLGLKALGVTGDADIPSLIAEKRPSLVLVTFERTGDAWERIAGQAHDNGIPVVAFGSHQNAGAFRRARELGCDQVLPNSRLHAELPQILQKWAGS